MKHAALQFSMVDGIQFSPDLTPRKPRLMRVFTCENTHEHSSPLSKPNEAQLLALGIALMLGEDSSVVEVLIERGKRFLEKSLYLPEIRIYDLPPDTGETP
jgi:hypothetical protein